MGQSPRSTKVSDEQILSALDKHDHNREKTAIECGIKVRSLYTRIAKLKKSGRYDGGVVDTVPNAHEIKGVSTYYDADGAVKGQWVKTSANAAAMDAGRKEALKAMADKLPKERPVQCKVKKQSSDLVNVYVLTDFHLGMKAWGEETGADWDTAIAEDLLVNWFAAAIELSPNAESCIFAQLGDFIHWDGLEAVTPTAHNILDADTRFQKVVRVAIRAIRRIVKMLRQKHKYVHIIMAEGNHDPASSIWLREWTAAIYEDAKGVTVDQSADPYYCHEFGDTSIFFHHGHKKKFGNIDDVFVAKFREVFGRTKHSYGHMGHYHSIKVAESNLMVVEQHRTLASPDAYAARGGWMSGREAKTITYHKRYGEVGRVSVTPEMV
jgi:hypothetical protein